MKSQLRAVAAGVCALGLIVLLAPASGRAHSITFDFTGTFVASDPHSIGGILTSPVGPFPASTVSGSFTFNGDTADANGSGTVGQYNGAIQSLLLSVTNIFGAPYQFGFNSAGPLNAIAVNSNATAANQSYVMSASVQNVVPAGPIVDGDNYNAVAFFINLLKPASSAFVSDALPQTPPSLSPFSLYDLVSNPQGQFRLVFQSSHGDHTIIGNLNSLTAVPLPAAAWLFGSGVIGLIGLARRRMNATV